MPLGNLRQHTKLCNDLFVCNNKLFSISTDLKHVQKNHKILLQFSNTVVFKIQHPNRPETICHIFPSDSLTPCTQYNELLQISNLSTDHKSYNLKHVQEKKTPKLKQIQNCK
jgi:hypothetical protein